MDAHSRGEGSRGAEVSFSVGDVGCYPWMSLEVSWSKISQTMEKGVTAHSYSSNIISCTRPDPRCKGGLF